MKDKQNEIDFYLNFGGFYHSEHSENIDSKEEMFGYNWEGLCAERSATEFCI